MSLAILLIIVILFYPFSIQVTKNEAISLPNATFDRLLMQEKWFTNWWIKELKAKKINDSIFEYKGIQFKVKQKMYAIYRIDLVSSSTYLQSNLFQIAVTKDSTKLTWILILPPHINPIKKWHEYQNSIRIGNALQDILESLKDYLNQSENVYGLSIKKNQLVNGFYLTTKWEHRYAPTLDDIYNHIYKLKVFAQTKGAIIIDSPMYHQEAPYKDIITCMVGIPINKEINGEGNIYMKIMPVHGNILSSTVTGGKQKIAHSFNTMALYVSEYQKTTMAIPYEIFLTNRLAIRDSNQWQTKLIMPIME